MPNQKTLIVALLKKYQNLAIEQVSNKVNMIKTMDIGAGLAGQEGMQVVQNREYLLTHSAS